MREHTFRLHWQKDLTDCFRARLGCILARDFSGEAGARCIKLLLTHIFVAGIKTFPLLNPSLFGFDALPAWRGVVSEVRI